MNRMKTGPACRRAAGFRVSMLCGGTLLFYHRWREIDTALGEQKHGTATQPPTILLVDDDADSLEVLRRLLVTLTPPELVASGHAARPVALVITDYHRPGMDGAQRPKPFVLSQLKDLIDARVPGAGGGGAPTKLLQLGAPKDPDD
jgi:hypothetical protein